MMRFDSNPNDEQMLPRVLPERVHSSLLKSRTVLIFGEITSELAQATTAQLLALASESEEPIRVVIHSPGGHVESGDTIHDVIRFIRPEIKMIGTGWVASAGALIFIAARRENRFALPNTRFLLHQPLGGVRGPASDIEIEAAQIMAARERLNRLFAEATGREPAKIAQETERNLWMTARQAQEYGLVHRVIESALDV
ncbi:ATP-dependent Clp protease ClpP [Sorangium cellulosum]|uniref:ATP-dependent Clp protease proteolytic subunit n=1 Tax=Sorangium cellulosum TaxID=56 RepID=A0A2L0EVL9_SORCE|nr:ATP-dependent Clp protease proteolytic subunit [Sorangium cellulosum]AUX43347.1 ATP-dependent Clp protease ClpP [Sorangium cellulosum]